MDYDEEFELNYLGYDAFVKKYSHEYVDKNYPKLKTDEERNKQFPGLNEEQRKAVDQIDGPLLIIAGPGTGKTQLLSMRIANILRGTDVNPENILAMTFTESGAQNMRDRLSEIIGTQSAYQVNNHTYHGFANELYLEYHDLLGELQPDRQIGDLEAFELANQIFADFSRNSYLNNGAPKQAQEVVNLVHELKKQDISASELREISTQNKLIADEINKRLRNINFAVFSGKKADEKVREAERILTAFANILQARINERVLTLAEVLRDNLSQIINEFRETNKPDFRKLSAFRDRVFALDKQKETILNKDFSNSQLLEIAEFYEKYDAAKAEKLIYDYDDMIANAIKLLEDNDDLRFTLQTKYRYILLDEYQDTNKAQARIVELLTREKSRPNVFAVGDDDQGIMAFQGAEYSNMENFAKMFTDTKILSLNKNYRSSKPIIDTAKNIIADAGDRLVNDSEIREMAPDLTKNLVVGEPEKWTDKPTEISRILFTESAAEFSFVAGKVREILGEKAVDEQLKTRAEDIAIIAPKHELLIEISRYFAKEKIAVKYEASENILDNQNLANFIMCARLVEYLSDSEKFANEIDYLWPQIFAMNFWDIDPAEVFGLSQSVKKAREIARLNHESAREKTIDWMEFILASRDKKIREIGQFFASLAALNLHDSPDDNFREDPDEERELTAKTSALRMLNLLAGRDEKFNQKFREKSVSGFETIIDHIKKTDANEYRNFAGYLNILAKKLASYRLDKLNLTLADFVDMIDAYRESGVKIPDTNPYTTGENAINLMTAHHAKGLQFKHVFLIAADNNNWNSKGKSPAIALPENLKFVRRPNDENERIRLFFVAITRAKQFLYLTGSRTDFADKPRTPLTFLGETWEKENDKLRSDLSPKIAKPFNKIREIVPDKLIEPDIIETRWQTFYTPENPKLRTVLADKIANFKFSPSALTSFYDLQYDGPQEFYESYILDFPSEQNTSANFGTVMHAVFDHFEKMLANIKNPTLGQIREIFDTDKMAEFTADKLRETRMSEEDLTREINNRVRPVFANFVKSRGEILMRPAASEIWIDNVLLDENPRIKLQGKIDRIEINRETKTVEIIDWKTGKISTGDRFPYISKNGNWGGKPKLWRYEIQLYFYKILLDNEIANSLAFREKLGIDKTYQVNLARLEFIEGETEPDSEPLTKSVEFNAKKMNEVKAMIRSLRARIDTLEFAETYPNKDFGVKEIMEFVEQEITSKDK